MAKKTDLETLCKQAVEQATALAESFRQIEPYFWGSDAVERKELLGEVSRKIRGFEKTKGGAPEELRRLHEALEAQAGEDRMVLEAVDAVLMSLRELSEARAVFSGGRPGCGGDGLRGGLPLETPARILRHHVLEVLRELGGRAKAGELFKALECRLGSGFLAGDLQPDAQGKVTWRGKVGMLRYSLVAEGVLRSDRATGVWELAGGKAKG